MKKCLWSDRQQGECFHQWHFLFPLIEFQIWILHDASSLSNTFFSFYVYVFVYRSVYVVKMTALYFSNLLPLLEKEKVKVDMRHISIRTSVKSLEIVHVHVWDSDMVWNPINIFLCEYVFLWRCPDHTVIESLIIAQAHQLCDDIVLTLLKSSHFNWISLPQGIELIFSVFIW